MDWNKKMETNDLDTSFQTIHINLPPKTTLIFGNLHNDNYTSYNQYFINGRSFNLVEMTIKTNDETIVVKPETFDNYFKKKNGSVSYVVKSQFFYSANATICPSKSVIYPTLSPQSR